MPILRGDLVRLRGERWHVVHAVAHDGTTVLETIGCGSDNRGEPGVFLLPYEHCERLPRTESPRRVGFARWARTARQALIDARPGWTSLRAAARADFTVLPYQLEPALALVRGDACRFLIADAVGLGKTIEAGLMIAETIERRREARGLIVCPASLTEQWQDELRRRFALRAVTLDSAALGDLALRLPADVNPWTVEPLVISSIDYVKRPEVMRSLESLTWDISVFDEAHNLTGRSDRAAAAGLIAERARAVVLLTATPHSGNDEAFARLCSLGSGPGSSLGRGGDASRLAIFRRSRLDAGLSSRSRKSVIRIALTPAESAMHNALSSYVRLVWNSRPHVERAGARLAMSVLARRACSSAGSLVRSVARRMALLSGDMLPEPSQPELPFGEQCDDAEAHPELGARGLEDPVEEHRLLTHLRAIAEAAASRESKIESLRRFLRRAGEPAIVFTEYRDTLEQLGAALAELDPTRLHGGMSVRERTEAMRRFTEGPSRLLLATDAASEGVNLQRRCRLVINLELPWTTLRLEQRAGRVDRIGQSSRVHIVHLVAANTFEESVRQRLGDRFRRSQDALNRLAEPPAAAELSAEVLGEGATIGAARIASPPGGVIAPDLRIEAEREAEALVRAHALARTHAGPESDGRAVVTCVRRRRGLAGPAEGFWLFRVALSCGDGHIFWEAALPLRAELTRSSLRDTQALRAAFASNNPALRTPLHVGGQQIVTEMREAMTPALAMAEAREHVLLNVLRARQGRLAGELRQFALFERGPERTSAAQADLLAEAVAECERRLAELTRRRQLRIAACDLVFGIARAR